MLLAVNSIPAYIERSSLFLVLAPLCQHADDNTRYCNFASWRGRGWCRTELLTAFLCPARIQMLQCCSVGFTPHWLRCSDALNLFPGEGFFSCCAMGHIVDGEPIPC